MVLGTGAWTGMRTGTTGSQGGSLSQPGRLAGGMDTDASAPPHLQRTAGVKGVIASAPRLLLRIAGATGEGRCGSRRQGAGSMAAGRHARHPRSSASALHPLQLIGATWVTGASLSPGEGVSMAAACRHARRPRSSVGAPHPLQQTGATGEGRRGSQRQGAGSTAAGRHVRRPRNAVSALPLPLLQLPLGVTRASWHGSLSLGAGGSMAAADRLARPPRSSAALTESLAGLEQQAGSTGSLSQTEGETVGTAAGVTGGQSRTGAPAPGPLHPTTAMPQAEAAIGAGAREVGAAHHPQQQQQLLSGGVGTGRMTGMALRVRSAAGKVLSAGMQEGAEGRTAALGPQAGGARHRHLLAAAAAALAAALEVGAAAVAAVAAVVGGQSRRTAATGVGGVAAGGRGPGVQLAGGRGWGLVLA